MFLEPDALSNLMYFNLTAYDKKITSVKISSWKHFDSTQEVSSMIIITRLRIKYLSHRMQLLQKMSVCV